MNVIAPFQKLFEPGQIGTIETRNRIVMPAMATGTSTEEGFVTQRTIDYYEERAKGGAGLIIVEFTCVDFPLGKGGLRQLSIDADRFLPGLKDLAKTIQKHGARAALQLHHAGNAARRKNTGCQPVGPSPISRPGSEVPRELSSKEIRDLINKFAEAAKRTQEAGFDGIEIHGAHSYLIAQFLSSAWNKRQDDYGGPLAKRARILLEILWAVREAVGESFPVWCRINGQETGIPGGTTLEEALELAGMIEEAGCDAISVSAADRYLLSSRPHFFPPGWAAHLAEAVKKASHVPIIAVGRITPAVGERLLDEGKTDFTAMGRALRADPELPNKLGSGMLQDIRPCIACMVCSEKMRGGGQRLCAVNPACGRERDYRITRVEKKKKVFIVGGGPGGMEAGRIAALAGHEVTLWEKGSRLGGKLLLASTPPFKEELMRLSEFLSLQIKKVGVTVELEKEVTAELVNDYKPDVVILAVGSTPVIPQMEGIDRKHVLTAEDVLGNEVEIGDNIAILGGGQVGCEVAAFLSKKGKKVTIVEMLESLAEDLGERQGRQFLLDYLAEKGVTFLTQTKGEEICEEGLVVTDKHGHRYLLPVDAVIFACGSMPNTDLLEKLKEIVLETYVVGDSVKARTVLEAMDESAGIARLL